MYSIVLISDIQYNDYICLHWKMITKISLVSIHHHSCFKAKIIFLVMRTFKIYLFISIQSLSHVQLFSTLWTSAHQASLSLTNSWSLLKLMSIELVMTSNHLILCRPLLSLPSIFPSNRVFPNESVLLIRWPKYWSFSFSISPSDEYSGLISFWID